MNLGAAFLAAKGAAGTALSFIGGNLTMILLIALGIATAASAMFYNFWQDEVTDFAKFKGGVEALGKQAEKDKKAADDLHAKTLKETKDEFKKREPEIASTAVAAYRARFPVRVCQPVAGGSGLSRGNSGPSGINAPAPEPVAVDEANDPFIADCAHDALTLGLWQDMARKNNWRVQ